MQYKCYTITPLGTKQRRIRFYKPVFCVILLLLVAGISNAQWKPVGNAGFSPRLGGWKGYESKRHPGITTLWIGLKYFKASIQGWELFRNVSTR